MADEQKPKSALDRAFETFETEVADCKIIRKELITQLREDAKKMRVSEYDKAMVIQAKMSVISTLSGMLKDVEDSAAKNIRLQLSRTEQENNGQYSLAIVNLLKMVRADGREAANEEGDGKSDEDIQKEIDARGQKLGITITEGELTDENASLTIPEAKKDPPKESEKTEEVEKVV